MKIILSILVLFSSVAFAAEPVYLSTLKEPYIPNCTQYPDKYTVQTGNWNSGSTWNGGTVPTANQSIKVEPAHTVTYNQVSTTEYGCIGVEGELKFKTDQDTELHFTTMNVYPDGTLRVGDTTTAIGSAYTAKLVVNNVAIDTQKDPFQHGNGILVQGNIYMHGREVANPVQYQTATINASQGTATLTTIGGISNWQAGDKLVFVDTRQRDIKHKWQFQEIAEWSLQHETMTIDTINTSTGYITFTTNFAYTHECVEDDDQTVEVCPKVANISRNVTVKSESATGTRGHTMFTHEGAVDVRYVEFIDLGRTLIDPLDSTIIDGGIITKVGTNQIGRYPIHMHHHVGPENPTNTGYQAILIGNVGGPGKKWNISVHNSHFGLYKHNIFMGDEDTGSLMITEQGNERENEFIGNFGITGGVPIERWYEPQYGGVGRQGVIASTHDFGYEGSCLWFTGKDNIIEDNFFAVCKYAGMMINSRPEAHPNGFGNFYPIRPRVRGARLEEINNPALWEDFNLQASPPVRSMQNNLVWGANVGLWVSFADRVGAINDNTFIRSSQQGAYVQRLVDHSLIDNIWLNKWSDVNSSYNLSAITGVDYYDQEYQSGQPKLIGGMIQGFRIGIDGPGFVNTGSGTVYPILPQETLVKDVKLKNYVNIRDNTVIKHGRTLILEDNEYDNYTAGTVDLDWLSEDPMDFKYSETGSFGNTRKLATDRVIIKGYGSGPNDLELYRLKQKSDHVMEEYVKPYTNPPVPVAQDNCPTNPGTATNADCYASDGVMTGNKIATCTDTTSYPLLDGYACDLSGAGGGGSITVDAGPNKTINEGDQVEITFTVSGGTGTGRTYAVDWDDGTADETGSIPDEVNSITVSRTFADGNATHTVTVTVDDDNSNTDFDTMTLTVNDVSPMGVVNGSGSGQEDVAYVIVPQITSDPGADTVTQWKVTWDDGSAEETFTAAATVSHSYANSGDYTITVKAVNEDGTFTIGTHAVNIVCSCN